MEQQKKGINENEKSVYFLSVGLAGSIAIMAVVQLLYTLWWGKLDYLPDELAREGKMFTSIPPMGWLVLILAIGASMLVHYNTVETDEGETVPSIPRDRETGQEERKEPGEDILTLRKTIESMQKKLEEQNSNRAVMEELQQRIFTLEACIQKQAKDFVALERNYERIKENQHRRAAEEAERG